MTYRGDDLDLRLPPGRSGSARGNFGESERQPDANGARYRVKAHRQDQVAPLWVDDVVLAVCNAAHEVAQALHSPEVLLQHVVHAMTRVSTATNALEKLSIDINALRRDVTALISNTAARAPGIELPVTSSEFRAVLRLAGETASRRGGNAIAVDDLLDVLMNYDADHPGIALLLAHAHRAGRAQPAPLHDDHSQAYQQAPPQESGAGYGVPEPSYALVEPLTTEPLYAATDSPNRPRLEGPSQGDLRASMGAMEERMIAKVSSIQAGHLAELQGLESERSALADLVRQLHSDVGAHRSETIHLRDALSEQLHNIERTALSHRASGSEGMAPVLTRLQGLERLFEQRIQDVGARWSGMGDRVEAMEASLSHQSHDMAEMKEALGSDVRILGEMLGKLKFDPPDFDDAFGTKLDTIETMLLERENENENENDAVAAALLRDHHEQIEIVLEDHRKQIAASMHEQERNWTAVNERLNKLEHIMASQHEVTQGAVADRKRILASVSERLAGLEKLVSMQDTLTHVARAQKTSAEFFDQWRHEANVNHAALDNRMATLEQNSTRPVAMLDSLSTNIRNLKAQMVEKTATPPLKAPLPPEGIWESFSNWMFGPR